MARRKQRPGARLALFTAGEEVMINATSPSHGVGNIGLSVTFGSSIVHIPAIVTVVPDFPSHDSLVMAQPTTA